MNTRTRTARRTLRDRTRSQRATAKIRREGVATLATHAISAGLGIREAASVAGSLRDKTEKAGVVGIAGFSFRKGVSRPCTRYSSADVAALVAYYRPRKPAYRLAVARLALAA
ncbi:hypothetical protein ABZ650_20545 [Streptomyces griseoviridis]|uniref:hypothetical protein n=1 Tax=Streptomyces griseoviridis TaxID=45398 RepID=UPI0033C3DD10